MQRANLRAAERPPEPEDIAGMTEDQEFDRAIAETVRGRDAAPKVPGAPSGLDVLQQKVSAVVDETVARAFEASKKARTALDQTDQVLLASSAQMKVVLEAHILTAKRVEAEATRVTDVAIEERANHARLVNARTVD